MQTVTKTQTFTLSVHLGVASHNGKSKTLSINVPARLIEFDPGDIFHACNRIGDLHYDLDGIEQRHSDGDNVWIFILQTLRTSIDKYGAPSMSVDDFIDVVKGGKVISRITCQPIGWTYGLPEAHQS